MGFFIHIVRQPPTKFEAGSTAEKEHYEPYNLTSSGNAKNLMIASGCVHRLLVAIIIIVSGCIHRLLV